MQIIDQQQYIIINDKIVFILFLFKISSSDDFDEPDFDSSSDNQIQQSQDLQKVSVEVQDAYQKLREDYFNQEDIQRYNKYKQKLSITKPTIIFQQRPFAYWRRLQLGYIAEDSVQPNIEHVDTGIMTLKYTDDIDVQTQTQQIQSRSYNLNLITHMLRNRTKQSNSQYDQQQIIEIIKKQLSQSYIADDGSIDQYSIKILKQYQVNGKIIALIDVDNIQQIDDNCPMKLILMMDSPEEFYFMHFIYPIDIEIINNTFYVLTQFGSIIMINLNNIDIDKQVQIKDLIIDSNDVFDQLYYEENYGLILKSTKSDSQYLLDQELQTSKMILKNQQICISIE